MALLSDRTYFPPLEEFLKGEKKLLSWNLVASALSDETSCDRLTSNAVSEFLKDPYVLDLLKSPYKAFAAPTAQSRSDLDTKTAAINVTPTPNDEYDIKTVKEDALWLSKCVKVNEAAALRVVVTELQSRAHAHLAGPLSTQDVANIQEAAGTSNPQATNALALLDASSTVDAETLWAEFDKEENKRRRLLTTYLSERRSFAVFADYTTSFMLYPKQPSRDPAADALRRDVVQGVFGQDAESGLDTEILVSLVGTYLEILPECITRAGTGLDEVVKEAEVLTEELRVDWVRTCLTEAIHCMTLVFQILHLSKDVFATPLIASQWFQFADDFGFLEAPMPDNDLISELILPLKSLVCAISLAILNLQRSIAYLDHEVELGGDEEPYINSSDALDVIHKAIIGAANANLATATPVILSWALILHRMDVSYQERAERRDLAQNQRAQAGFELDNQPYPTLGGRRSSVGSIVSIEPARYDRFLGEKVLQQDQQLVERLAMSVTDGGQVYDVISDIAICAGSTLESAFRPVVGSRIRLVLLDLLKASFPIVGYQSEPVSALLATLSGGQRYWDLTPGAFEGSDEAVVAFALQDPLLLQFYVFRALSRYPYEFLPFTAMCRTLSACLCTDDRSDVVAKSLLKTPSLTLILSDRFEYELVNEDENTNSMVLTEDVELFPPVQSRRRLAADEKSIFIPSGSFGQFLIDGGRLARIDYEHSTIALLGKRLDVNLAEESYEPTLGFLDLADTAETIGLLATLIRAETLKSASKGADGARACESGLAILEEASRELSNTKDIVTVVCDVIDNFIQADSVDSDGAVLAVLAASMEFLHAVLPICPGRVWSYMARCQLLSTESRAGRLSRLTGASDLVSERFDFLTSSIRFLSSLIDSVTDSAVQRKVGSKFGGRQKDHEGLWLGTSDKILEQVSLSVAQTAIDVFENTSTWRFASELHRSILVRDVVRIMHDLILYTCSLEAPESRRGLVGALEPAAQFVVDSFLSSSSGSLRFQPLLVSLMAGLEIPDSTLYPRRAGTITDRATVSLDFAASLLRVATHLDKPSTVLQTQIFQVASVLARLCAARDSFTSPTVDLLGTLVATAGTAANEPPSLLGYLGPQVSVSFLKVLTGLDKPFQRSRAAVGIWKFFSAIVRNRQQWMANCLLTGKAPREALKGDGKVAKLSPDSVLSAAKDTLRSISSIPSSEALAVLNFFTSAQNYWPWTIFAIRSENDFLDNLRKYVHDLKSAASIVRSDPAAACDQARIAAYIAETFAMQLYHLRQMGKEEVFARDVVQDLDYFLRDGVAVSGYNTSLHVNFQKNFANRYPGCSLEDFKRTLLSSKDLGNQYYYAVEFADKMLAFDPAWVGSRDNGFKKEMETANLNLSLVDAQIALFHAWEFLLLELSDCLLPSNKRIPVLILQVAEQCLTANQDIQGPEQIFVKVALARANLSLMLLQRLADCSMLPKDISQLLGAAWSTITAVENPFAPEQVQYYRTLLRVLYVILRGSRHSDGSKETSGNELVVATTQTVLNILDRVVAQGFRTLVTLIHDPEATAYPEDMALITAVLQACLSTPGLDQCQSQTLNIMASQDVLHVASSLFTWADKLADKGDPIYGELSLLFLLELSTLPLVAEQLACDGFLGHLTSAGLATHMRRPNVSPFADSVAAQRCYSIWAKAVLPLLLNILIALGMTIAPEIAFVLNQFPNLLAASVERFEAPGLSRTGGGGAASSSYVTLLAASEVHSLALLVRVLTALRQNNPRDIPEVVWEAAPLLENVEFWLSRPKVLRERLLPLGPREAEWRTMEPRRAKTEQVDNRLEEKAVDMLEAVRMVLSESPEDE